MRKHCVFICSVVLSALSVLAWYPWKSEPLPPADPWVLADRYLSGSGKVTDRAAVEEWLRTTAEQGDAETLFQLGQLYWGASGSKAEVAELFRKAGQRGHAEAQRLLGLFYSVGEGVPADAAEAARWYRRAAEQGDVVAQCKIADRYRLGRGVPCDVVEAYRWYFRAASAGDRGASVHLDYLSERMTYQERVEARHPRPAW